MPKMKTYDVYFTVDGMFHAKVQAENPHDAKLLVSDLCSDADFGPLENIDWSYHHMETED